MDHLGKGSRRRLPFFYAQRPLYMPLTIKKQRWLMRLTEYASDI
jgi:hypothetical protein